MFGKGDIKTKFPMLSDIIDTGLEHESEEGLSWDELKGRGTVSETIEQNDDGMTKIIRKFISYDKTSRRKQVITLETKFYEQFKGNVDIKDVIETIDDLKDELEEYIKSNSYEICAVIRDQIDFLTETFKLKEHK